MSFALRLIIIILFLVLVEYYFVRKSIRSVKDIFPNLSKKKTKLITVFGLTWLNLFPLATFTLWTYSRIAQVERFAQPTSFFMNT